MTARGIVVGAGSHIFQAAHLPALDVTGIEVVGAFDVDPARLADVSAARSWRITDDLSELLELDAELAIVCAPHPMHADLVARCLGAGFDVVVEKPVAARLSEIDSMIDAQRQSGRTLAVVHQHRCRSEVIEAKALIDAGELGRVHRIIATGSFPKRSSYYTDVSWRGTWRGEGGGVLLNQGLHTIDLLVHLLGPPTRVAASLRAVLHPVETDDTADLLIAWNQAMGSVHITSAAAVDDERVEIYGSSGALRIDRTGLHVRRGTDFDAFALTPGGHFDVFQVPTWRLATPHGGGRHEDVYRNVLEARERGVPPVASAASARTAVEVIAAATLASSAWNWTSLPLDARAWDHELDARIESARK